MVKNHHKLANKKLNGTLLLRSRKKLIAIEVDVEVLMLSCGSLRYHTNARSYNEYSKYKYIAVTVGKTPNKL